MGIAAIGMASYAATFMRVVQTDGNVVEYDVESVSLVDFVNKEIPTDTISVIPTDTSVSNHPYVDLGLPSGTLWATYNIGATKPEEYGDYFAWGETEPKDVYDWSTYKYAKVNENGNFDSFTKYNMSGYYGGIIDNLSVLLPEDDAAAANWGSEWKMPTNEEQRELINNSYMVWTNGYNDTDVRGVIFYKAKEDSDKGQYIDPWMGEPSADYSVSSDAHVFFPAAGYRYGSGVSNEGDYGSYWSSSLIEEDEGHARRLYFGEELVYCYFNYRYNGFPVRAVRVQK